MICVLGMIYLAFSLFFIQHYYFGTKIGDIDCGGMTAEDLKSIIAERADHYTLTIEGRDGMKETLTASEINLQFSLDDTPEKIAAMQNGFAWFSFLWNPTKKEMPLTVSYEEPLLDESLRGMGIFQESRMRRPVNAYVGEYDEESGYYHIIEEDRGTVIDRQKAKEAVIAALENMEAFLNLEEANCYLEPEISQDDVELNQFCSRLNRFVTSRIVYDWHGMEETVDGSLIHAWLDIDRENRTVLINAEAVKEYVDSLSKKYDTFGKIREFKTSEGKNILLKPGSYGWRVNRTRETEKLIKLIRAGWQGEREPEYLYTAAVKGEDDIGDSYVEINLTAQHLYLYVDGQLVTESDFVSGNVSRGFATPDGVYGLTYKTMDATLKGPGYATPVKYWMPFNGNIGMHDAKWRRQFGGQIYLHNGSHGCINLPVEEAEKIYEQIYKGFPVICYKDESAEKNKHQKAEQKSETVPTETPTENPPSDAIQIPTEDPTVSPEEVPAVDPAENPAVNPEEVPVEDLVPDATETPAELAEKPAETESN